MTRRARRGVRPLPPTGNKSVLQAETQRDGQVQVLRALEQALEQAQQHTQVQAPPQVLAPEQGLEQAPAQA